MGKIAKEGNRQQALGGKSEVRFQISDFRRQKERGRTGWGEGQKLEVRSQGAELGRLVAGFGREGKNAKEIGEKG